MTIPIAVPPLDIAALKLELRSEKTSYLMFWVAHPAGLMNDLTEGRLDSVKPAQAMAVYDGAGGPLTGFEAVANAIGDELDQRVPARQEAT